MAITLSDVSSEVLLRILEHLDDARDLARIRQTSRRLRSIGRDPLLWKALFQQTFLINSTADVDVVGRSCGGSSKRRKTDNLCDGDSEETDAQPHADTDWYSLYKVSHNWRTGNYAAHSLEVQDTTLEALPDTKPNFTTRIARNVPETLVVTSDDHVFTASRDPITSARDGHLLAYPANTCDGGKCLSSIARLSLPLIDKDNMCAATAIAIENPSIRSSKTLIYMACTDATLRVITFDKVHKKFRQEACSSIEATSEIRLLAVCASLLATCTLDFHMALYQYQPELAVIRPIGTRRGHGCQWPATMRMTRSMNDTQAVQLTVAYVKNTYPSGWTVALQQFDVGPALFSAFGSASAPRFSPMAILPPKDFKGKDKAQELNDDMVLNIERLTSLCYEDDFIVVGSRDNSVFCFKVDREQSDGSPQKSDVFRIRHLSTIQEHTGSVHSVSLDDGRCVTGGADGSVKVWRLSNESAYLSRTFGLTARFRTKFRSGLGKVVTLRIPDEGQAGRKDRKRKCPRKGYCWRLYRSCFAPAPGFPQSH
jgi:hypothetical protein